MNFTTYKKHQKRVAFLQEILREEHAEVTLAADKPSNALHQTSYKAQRKKLEFSQFCHVLEINEKEEWIVVEPRITFSKLVTITLNWGMIPLVVPEFKTITVGGAVMGAALESSSHRYGQFNDTCLEYELLLGDGSIICASKEKHSDLFFSVPGSYGTLALLTLVKVKLKKTLPYVQVNRFFYQDRLPFLAHLKKETPSEMIEGIALSKNNFVVIEGNTCSSKGKKLHFFSPWYYQEKKKEIYAIKEYLFRLDRGAFWMGRSITSPSLLLKSLLSLNVKTLAYEVKNRKQKDPSFFFRLLFGWAFSSKFLYTLWHKVPLKILENLFFIHDFYVPSDSLDAVYTHFTSHVHIYPLWFCPIRGTTEKQLFSPHDGKKRYVNLGIYGIPKEDAAPLSAQLERAILEFGGKKMLYSLTYYSEEEFRQAYDMKTYETLREKYHAKGRFPHILQKIRTVL